MKTPREILLGRHRTAQARLDTIRREAMRSVIQEAPSATPQPSTLDILARRSEAKAVRPSLLSTLNHHLSTILAPSPKAWAGLGCVWILIFALHAASRSNSPRLAQVSAPKSATVLITALKDREQMLVELMGNSHPSDAHQPRRLGPQPRSERRVATVIV